jgi:hypothetical protein
MWLRPAAYLSSTLCYLQTQQGKHRDRRTERKLCFSSASRKWPELTSIHFLALPAVLGYGLAIALTYPSGVGVHTFLAHDVNHLPSPGGFLCRGRGETAGSERERHLRQLPSPPEELYTSKRIKQKTIR